MQDKNKRLRSMSLFSFLKPSDVNCREVVAAGKKDQRA